jgi:hypothetical protein
MESDRIAMSQRERDRLNALHDVKQKHRAVIHGLRGRSSNRKLAAQFEQKTLARVRQRCMQEFS